MKPKKIKLQNYKSGRVIESESITEFVRVAGLKKIDKYHFTAVLNGDRLHHKGWHLPSDKKYLISDIYGNEYLVNNILLFCKTHNLSTGKIRQLVNFEIPDYNGLFMAGANPPIFEPRKILQYEFKNGDQKVKSETISEAGQEIGISPGPLYKISHGLQSQTQNGWRLTKITEKKYKGKIL